MKIFFKRPITEKIIDAVYKSKHTLKEIDYIILSMKEYKELANSKNGLAAYERPVVGNYIEFCGVACFCERNLADDQ